MIHEVKNKLQSTTIRRSTKVSTNQQSVNLKSKRLLEISNTSQGQKHCELVRHSTANNPLRDMIFRSF